VAPEVLVEQQGPRQLAVRVQAPAYLYFLHLIVPSETARFDDNYFDLAAGQSRTILVTDAARDLRPEDVTVRSC
jgi:beta-mannosidase